MLILVIRILILIFISAEIDEDGSGTMDFEEFCELMMASPEED